MPVYDIDGNELASGESEITIKDYFTAEMADTVSKVRALQTEPNLTFFVVTDIHAYFATGMETLYKTSVENMRYLLTEVPCDGVINLGDTIDGYPLASTAKEYGNLISNEFRKIGIPYYSVIGNHDDNRYHSTSSERLSVGQRYQLLVNPTRGVVPDLTGLNYYVDFPEFKVRMVCLNSVSDYTYKFTTDTCTWFSSVALNTPDDYGVIVASHVSPFTSWNYSEAVPTNSATIMSALSTYAASKEVIAFITGHNHVDDVFTAPYPGFTLGCEKFENDTSDQDQWPAGAVKPIRTAGTASEDLWTVVVVRPESRKVNLVRFGAGSDYEISY